jgi:hypothetical protein
MMFARVSGASRPPIANMVVNYHAQLLPQPSEQQRRVNGAARARSASKKTAKKIDMADEARVEQNKPIHGI